jgi:hypothetical protein
LQAELGPPDPTAHLGAFVRRESPEAAFQTLLGLGSQHPPVLRRTIVGASDLSAFHEGDEIADATA